jgi:hypothetical protein
METSGKKLLVSGNVFEWRIAEVGGRGCALGGFTLNPPTDTDIAEAKEFVTTLVPEDSTAGPAAVGTRSQLIEKATDHFTHNAKHN